MGCYISYRKKKNTYLLGDFNINLLNNNEHRPTNDFLDSLLSSSLLSYTLQPTQLTGHSKALIDNIFFNLTPCEVISGNVTATTSDHLPQFLIALNVFANPFSNKSNSFERTDWEALLKIEQQNINFFLETYLSKINSLLDTHAPLKKISKYKLTFKTKPCITPGLQKSFAVKNKLLKKFIHLKEPHKKLHSDWKTKNS